MDTFQLPEVDTSRYQFPLQAFVGGRFVDSVSNDKHTLVSSVNDSLITTELQWSNAEDVDLAVDAAANGLEAWQSMTKASENRLCCFDSMKPAKRKILQEQRRDALINYAGLIRENREQLHWFEAVLVGKDAGFCNFEIDFAAELFIYYGGMVDNISSEVLHTAHDVIRYTLRQPWGICAGICPFNAPLVTLAMKAAPALACGNAIIIKTSEYNPFSTLFMASLANQAGIPAGVLNCLTGGAEAGDALASHMRIRKISFTGSIATGKLVQVAAARSNLKSVTTELGGKSPIIVFPDADMNEALSTACMLLMLNGQGCALGTRLYLHDFIADEFTARLVAAVEEHARGLGGSPTSPDTRSSPLYNRRQKETVLSYIKSAKGEATLLTGGKALGEKKGCYVEPTIFINPSPNARVLTEEIFGPVLVIKKFSSDEEVLHMANNTEYGLAAYVMTKDIGRALRFTCKLEAGTVNVNGLGGINAHVPMGGWKQSGQGIENGREAMLDWTQTKSVVFRG